MYYRLLDHVNFDEAPLNHPFNHISHLVHILPLQVHQKSIPNNHLILSPIYMLAHQNNFHPDKLPPSPLGLRRAGFKPKNVGPYFIMTCLVAAIINSTESKGFKSSMKSPHWVAAMDDEIRALHCNHTWELVPRPSGTNIVGSKWVYHTKYISDGSIDRYKARSVVQGFTQILGFSYSHTFSPVVRATTVRIVLALAVIRKWPLHQLDIKTALIYLLVYVDVISFLLERIYLFLNSFLVSTMNSLSRTWAD